MAMIRKNIVLCMTVAILCSLFVAVFAVGAPDTEDEVLPPAVNAYEFAKAPEGVYVFRYYGSDPYADLDIDTSECVVDRLYVYHSEADSVMEITAQEVSDYTCTQTALYYVTEEEKVYKTDYNGTNHEYLYQCSEGAISMLSSYYDTLYFIEDQTRIMHLDVASKTAQEIWAYEYLDWVFMLDNTQLIATTAEEEDYLYDISTNTATRISSIVATNMVTAAIKGTLSNNARTTTTPNFSIMVTQENNVSFPIEPYWATPDDNYSKVDGCYYSSPSSWFHDNGQEGCSLQNCTRYSGSGECKGFAKYVHDVYAHMDVDTSIDSNGNEIADDVADGLWEKRTCIIRHSYMNDANDIDNNTLKLWPSDSRTNTTKIQEFFESLHTGSYVRYGKYLPVRSETGEIIVSGDDSPWNGCHSIVFIASDDDGIWVYECNQDYTGLEDGETLNGHTQDYYGCGVFIQYYSYTSLFRYKYILNYVNHNYPDNWGYLDKDYHSKKCTNCIGYVKKEHTNVSVTIMTNTKHSTTYSCCGHSVIASHTGTVRYTQYSQMQHKVTATCCSGQIYSPHTYVLNANNRYICTGCGKDRDINVIGPTAGFGEPMIAVVSKE